MSMLDDRSWMEEEDIIVLLRLTTTGIGVVSLASPETLIEIEVIAESK